uniref:Uncharacterized protein n=1 Tax=Romanomermis culicivorax TaxID=13658 RepID=A0A915IN14_ROMCU
MWTLTDASASVDQRVYWPITSLQVIVDFLLEVQKSSNVCGIHPDARAKIVVFENGVDADPEQPRFHTRDPSIRIVIRAASGRFSAPFAAKLS